MVGAVIGGVIGAALGAGAWAGIGFATGYEIGWLAWGIGILVGVGVRIGGKGNLSASTALLAAALAAIAVAGGKYAMLYGTIENELAAQPQLTDEHVISFVADDIIAERYEADEPVDWPRGVDPNDAWVEADYPPDVWTEAVAHWDSLDASGRAEWRAYAEGAGDVDVMSLTNELYTSTFGIFDVLWFALAIGSAYKLGTGEESAEA